MTFENEIEKIENLAGKDSDTATEEEGLELNNASVPTPEQEENANIASNPEPEKEIVEATTAETEPELGLAETEATKPMFTQSQVDEIAGKVRKETREKVTRDFFSRYGVNTTEELDDLFSDAQRFIISQDEFAEKAKKWEADDAARNDELMSLKEKVALLESGIDKNRYEDAKFILKGKGLDVTAENIAQELATHPEWKVEVEQKTVSNDMPFRKLEPATKIDVPQVSTLGNNSNDNPSPELSERERAMKLFGL